MGSVAKTVPLASLSSRVPLLLTPSLLSSPESTFSPSLSASSLSSSAFFADSAESPEEDPPATPAITAPTASTPAIGNESPCAEATMLSACLAGRSDSTLAGACARVANESIPAERSTAGPAFGACHVRMLASGWVDDSCPLASVLSEDAASAAWSAARFARATVAAESAKRWASAWAAKRTESASCPSVVP